MSASDMKRPERDGTGDLAYIPFGLWVYILIEHYLFWTNPIQ